MAMSDKPTLEQVVGSIEQDAPAPSSMVLPTDLVVRESS